MGAEVGAAVVMVVVVAMQWTPSIRLILEDDVANALSRLVKQFFDSLYLGIVKVTVVRKMVPVSDATRLPTPGSEFHLGCPKLSDIRSIRTLFSSLFRQFLHNLDPAAAEALDRGRKDLARSRVFLR